MGRLYDKNLKAVLGKERDKIAVLSDGHGLGARVSEKGKIRWQYRYKIEGKNKRIDFGDYPAITLVKARELTAQCRQWLAEGLDPKVQRDLARRGSLRPVTVKDALEYWLVEYAELNRANFAKHRDQFKKHIYPYIGSFPVEKTETQHWVECFDRIRKGIKGKQRAAPVAAGYILQNSKQALKFCRVRKYCTSRVLDDLNVNDIGQKQRKKDRVLTTAEMIDVWLVPSRQKMMDYYKNLIKILMIFGARSQEVRLSTWQEWDLQEMLWTVPESNSKTGKKIIRPIPQSLKAWLCELQGNAKSSDFLLGSLKTPETVSQLGRNLWKRLEHNEAWTLHDLRRTFATRLNDLGVAPHIVEQLLGHSLGGVMAVYNLSQYIPEKRTALDMWLEHLEALTTSDNVISFAKMN